MTLPSPPSVCLSSSAPFFSPSVLAPLPRFLLLLHSLLPGARQWNLWGGVPCPSLCRGDDAPSSLPLIFLPLLRDVCFLLHPPLIWRCCCFFALFFSSLLSDPFLPFCGSCSLFFFFIRSVLISPTSLHESEEKKKQLLCMIRFCFLARLPVMFRVPVLFLPRCSSAPLFAPSLEKAPGLLSWRERAGRRLPSHSSCQAGRPPLWRSTTDRDTVQGGGGRGRHVDG